MKIARITNFLNINNQYYQNNKAKIQTETGFIPQNRIQKDNVCFSGKLYNFLGIDPVWNFHNFSISEYSKLTKSELKKLQKEYLQMAAKNPREYERIEWLHDGVSEYIRQKLDKQYGEGNYIVITIGRSISSIGKVLGYKIGEQNVINIPMTNAAKFFDMKRVDALANKKELRLFLQYLESIGLSKKHIEESGKNYVITDFCCSGCSLTGAENLLNSKYIWNDAKNVKAIDFVSDWAMNNDQSIINDFMRGEYKKLAFVSRCCKLSDCADRTINPIIEPRQTKLIWFRLLDNVMQKQAEKGLTTVG